MSIGQGENDFHRGCRESADRSQLNSVDVNLDACWRETISTWMYAVCSQTVVLIDSSFESWENVTAEPIGF